LISFFFQFGIGVSATDPTRYKVNILQGGFPFPSRDMLVGPTNVSAAYTRHISNMLQLAGEERMAADERAKRIFDFQTEIARFTSKSCAFPRRSTIRSENSQQRAIRGEN
jgi:predicted metalloendopeptidase